MVPASINLCARPGLWSGLSATERSPAVVVASPALEEAPQAGQLPGTVGKRGGGGERPPQRRKDRVRDTPGGDPAPSSLQAAVPHHTTRIPRAPSASRVNFPRANGLGARVAFVQKQQRGKKRSEGHHCPRMPRQSDTTRGRGPNIVPHSGFPSLPCNVLLGKAQQARRAGKGGATHERNPRPRKAAGPGGGAGRV